MRFEWDERKNVINRRKHGFDFSQVAELFQSGYMEPDDRSEEERWRATGMIGSLVAIAIITFRSEETIRVISLRKATQHEQDNYFAQILGN